MTTVTRPALRISTFAPHLAGLAAERLREVLFYEVATGQFSWRVQRGCKRSGQPAGTLTDGYVQISVDGRIHKAHRLAWLYVHGAWPAGAIDHANGNRADNRIGNLRDVSITENNENRRSATAGKSSPYLGVSWYAQLGKWRAQIQSKRKNHCLGYFDDPAKAHAAYIEAKRRLHTGGTL